MACRCHECSISTSCRVVNCSQCCWLFSLRHDVTTFSLALWKQTKIMSLYETVLKNELLVFVGCMNRSHLEPIMLHFFTFWGIFNGRPQKWDQYQAISFLPKDTTYLWFLLSLFSSMLQCPNEVLALLLLNQQVMKKKKSI